MDDPLDYPRLLTEALVGVVRRALRVAEAEGLPGDHHFYLTFRTDAPGVELSPPLRKRHPEQMTIVLQHQFWELRVDEDAFSVALRFGGTLERLRVPFAALTAFVDPAASFGLRLGPEAAPAEQQPDVAARADREPRAEPEAPVEPEAAARPPGAVVDMAGFRKRQSEKEE